MAEERSKMPENMMMYTDNHLTVSCLEMLLEHPELRPKDDDETILCSDYPEKKDFLEKMLSVFKKTFYIYEDKKYAKF